MKRWAIALAGFVFLETASVRAEWLTDWCWWKKWYGPSCCAPGCCPDDYCPKKLPSVVPVKCGGPCDYCPKSLPKAPPAPPGTCCDYCPKPIPPVFPLVPGPWHTCGPPEKSDCPR